MRKRFGEWIFLGALILFLLFDMTLIYQSAWENWMPLGCVIDLSNVEPEGEILLFDGDVVTWDFEGTKEGLGSGMIFAAPMKLVYFPMALLVLLIPNAKFSNAKAWMIKQAMHCLQLCLPFYGIPPDLLRTGI